MKTPDPSPLLKAALAEDFGRAGDPSTRRFLPRRRVRARVIAKAPGVLCGIEIAAAALRRVCPRARVRLRVRDGSRLRVGQTVLEASGPPELLSAERTALNFLTRLSGIATLTRRYVEAARGTGVPVYDTRKTTPGWRALEKYAVRCGGGTNHRMGLYDGVMLKDNHIRLLKREGGDWRAALKNKIALFKRRRPGVEVEIEAQSLAEARALAALGADVLMLDNMTRPQMRRAIRFLRAEFPRVAIEISGGVTLKTLRSFARLGPDRISVGRLTHSAPALDLSLETE